MGAGDRPRRGLILEPVVGTPCAAGAGSPSNTALPLQTMEDQRPLRGAANLPTLPQPIDEHHRSRLTAGT
jgi:hypothetical protein